MDAVATGELEDLRELWLGDLPVHCRASEQTSFDRADQHVTVAGLPRALDTRAGVFVGLLETTIEVCLAEQRVVDPAENARARPVGDQGLQYRVQPGHLVAISRGNRHGEQLRRRHPQRLRVAQ